MNTRLPDHTSQLASPQQPPDRPHVLLVDDDLEIIQSMRYALESAGFQVSMANDGNAGIALLETISPNLLVLDMMMPKRSGFLVLEQIRRLGLEDLPVIMVTANEGDRHRQYAELLGVSQYLHKPFPMERLIECARRLTSTAGGI
ncbi:MAG: response regulator [Pirellulaceae bacterium]|nr:response regulator [Pirellulaceae bacterium]